MNDNIEVRKLQVALYTRGVGVILFGFWGVIKVFLMMFMNYDGFSGSFSVSPTSYSYSFNVTSIAFIIVFIFGGLNAYFYILIGRRAISLSRGKLCGNGTLILAGFFVVVSFIFLFISIYLTQGEEFSEYCVSYLTALTEDILLIEIIVFSKRLKRRLS